MLLPALALLKGISSEDFVFSILGPNIKWEIQITGGVDAILVMGLRGTDGKERKFRGKDQIEVSVGPYPQRYIWSSDWLQPRRLFAPGERRVQCSRWLASLNVIAHCNASPETLSVPWKAVQSDALMSITLNVTVLHSLRQTCFMARDDDS